MANSAGSGLPPWSPSQQKRVGGWAWGWEWDPGLPGDPPSASLPTADHRSAFFFWGVHEPTDSNQTVESWVLADNVGQTQWLGACKETESPGAGRDEGDWEDGGQQLEDPEEGQAGKGGRKWVQCWHWRFPGPQRTQLRAGPRS